METNSIFDGISDRKYEVTAEELERRYGQIRSSLAAKTLDALCEEMAARLKDNKNRHNKSELSCQNRSADDDCD